ncbi:hypothetical protein [Nocardiopsis synnemataformans]
MPAYTPFPLGLALNGLFLPAEQVLALSADLTARAAAALNVTIPG